MLPCSQDLQMGSGCTCPSHVMGSDIVLWCRDKLGDEKWKTPFDFIAPFYALFFGFQVRYYHRILDRVRDRFDLREYRNTDVGCRSGASPCAGSKGFM